MKNIIKNTLLYIGLFIAFLLVFSCLQLYVDTNRLFGNTNNQTNYWLTFSKKITPENIGRKELLGFDENEIKTIKSWNEVHEVYPFSANEFKSSANGGDFIPFYTDLYFEGVDIKAIDIPLTNEEFRVKDDVIPIVISKEYLNLYNYGFALNKGLPQISEEFAKKIKVNINIEINKQNKTYVGELVGLSDRIHSVLIPKEFLDSINLLNNPQLASTAKNYNRILVQIKESNDKELVSKMKKYGYQSNQDGLRSAKIKGQVYLVLKSIIVLGVFIFLLCLYMIINVIKIQFLETQEEVSIRYGLGYSPMQMVSTISKKFSLAIACIMLFCLLIISIAQYFIAQSEISNGNLSNFIHPLLFLGSIIIPILIYFLVRKMIYKWLINLWKI